MVSHAKHMSDDELTAALRTLALRPSLAEVDPELLEAYLDGTASPEDTARLRELLAQSGELRDELLGMAAIARGTLEFQTLPRPWVPERHREKRDHTRTFQLLGGLAAVLAIAFGLAQGLRQESAEPLSLVADKAYYGEQFEVDALRTEVSPQPRLPRNHREAALLAFRQRLRWVEGEVLLQETPASSGSSRGGRSISLRTEGGTRYQTVVPPEATDPRLAILRVPALSLSWAGLSGNGDEFQIPEIESSDQILMAVAYQTPTGFDAVLAIPR